MIKIFYWLLARYSWGYGLVSSVLDLMRNIATALVFLALLFKINFGIKGDILIGLLAFFVFVGLGEWLKVKGYLDYAAKMGNSVNPELKKINQIAEHLGVK